MCSAHCADTFGKAPPWTMRHFRHLFTHFMPFRSLLACQRGTTPSPLVTAVTVASLAGASAGVGYSEALQPWQCGLAAEGCEVAVDFEPRGANLPLGPESFLSVRNVSLGPEETVPLLPREEPAADHIRLAFDWSSPAGQAILEEIMRKRADAAKVAQAAKGWSAARQLLTTFGRGVIMAVPYVLSGGKEPFPLAGWDGGWHAKNRDTYPGWKFHASAPDRNGVIHVSAWNKGPPERRLSVKLTGDGTAYWTPSGELAMVLDEGYAAYFNPDIAFPELADGSSLVVDPSRGIPGSEPIAGDDDADNERAGTPALPALIVVKPQNTTWRYNDRTGFWEEVDEKGHIWGRQREDPRAGGASPPLDIGFKPTRFVFEGPDGLLYPIVISGNEVILGERTGRPISAELLQSFLTYIHQHGAWLERAGLPSFDERLRPMLPSNVAAFRHDQVRYPGKRVFRVQNTTGQFLFSHIPNRPLDTRRPDLRPISSDETMFELRVATEDGSLVVIHVKNGEDDNPIIRAARAAASRLHVNRPETFAALAQLLMAHHAGHPLQLPSPDTTETLAFPAPPTTPLGLPIKLGGANLYLHEGKYTVQWKGRSYPLSEARAKLLAYLLNNPGATPDPRAIIQFVGAKPNGDPVRQVSRMVAKLRTSLPDDFDLIYMVFKKGPTAWTDDPEVRATLGHRFRPIANGGIELNPAAEHAYLRGGKRVSLTAKQVELLIAVEETGELPPSVTSTAHLALVLGLNGQAVKDLVLATNERFGTPVIQGHPVNGYDFDRDLLEGRLPELPLPAELGSAQIKVSAHGRSSVSWGGESYPVALETARLLSRLFRKPGRVIGDPRSNQNLYNLRDRTDAGTGVPFDLLRVVQGQGVATWVDDPNLRASLRRSGSDAPLFLRRISGLLDVSLVNNQAYVLQQRLALETLQIEVLEWLSRDEHLGPQNGPFTDSEIARDLEIPRTSVQSAITKTNRKMVARFGAPLFTNIPGRGYYIHEDVYDAARLSSTTEEELTAAIRSLDLAPHQSVVPAQGNGRVSALLPALAHFLERRGTAGWMRLEALRTKGFPLYQALRIAQEVKLAKPRK